MQSPNTLCDAGEQPSCWVPRRGRHGLPPPGGAVPCIPLCGNGTAWAAGTNTGDSGSTLLGGPAGPAAVPWGSSGSCPPGPPPPYGAPLAPLTPRPPSEAQRMPPTRAPLLLCWWHSEPHDLTPWALPLGGCSGDCVGRATWLPGSAGEGAGGWQGAYPAGPPGPHQGSCYYEEEAGEGGRASGQRAGTGGRTRHLKI